MESFVAWSTASPPRPGVERVLHAGRAGAGDEGARACADGVPVDSVTWAEIVAAGRKVGLAAEDIEASVR